MQAAAASALPPDAPQIAGRTGWRPPPCMMPAAGQCPTMHALHAAKCVSKEDATRSDGRK
eukprot:364904-Chlamydomonas_euryale.AAC.9